MADRGHVRLLSRACAGADQGAESARVYGYPHHKRRLASSIRRMHPPFCLPSLLSLLSLLSLSSLFPSL
eukprot:3153137-Rhodomonas_salina.1